MHSLYLYTYKQINIYSNRTSVPIYINTSKLNFKLNFIANSYA